jgi:hypothetical protein
MMPNREEPETRRDTHPAASQVTERILMARRVSYSFEPNLALANLRVWGYDGSCDASSSRVPEHTVNHYAEQMRRGAVFPAIATTDQFEVFDGIARYAAAVKNGDATIAAYVCFGVSPQERLSLAIELNQAHGLRMTDEEVREFIAGCVRHGVGLDVTTSARITGVKRTMLTRWITVERFWIRATKLGLSTDEARVIPDAHAVALSGARLDAVFAAAIDLATACTCTAAELRDIVTAANGAQSEIDAIAKVASARTERASDQESQTHSESTRRRTTSALHVGGLLRFAVDDLLDVAPERQRDTFTGMCVIRDLLSAAIAAAEVNWPASAVRSMQSAVEVS